jgi:DNA-binding NarL/FixJ family response regulator
MPEAVKVVLVLEHLLFAEALGAALAGEEGIDVVAVTTDPGEVPSLCRAHAPHVLIVDLDHDQADPAMLAEWVAEVGSSTRMLALFAPTDPQRLSEVLAAGAHGVLLKGESPAQLPRLIRRLAAGELVLRTEHLAELVAHLRAAARERSGARRAREALTSREIEVLRLIGHNHTTGEIARRLFISPLTVQSHVNNILDKLGVRSRLEAVTSAVRSGLITMALQEDRDAFEA